ncbi:SoxR reducing system RseC family protein [bacterium]|nr:SoxR reducing system RseC family protein [bacterium]
MRSLPTNGAPRGVVLRTDGTRAEVSTSRRGACSACSEAAACGMGEAERCDDVVAVRNAVGARVGDTVELDLPGNAVLRLSLLVWIVPLAGLLLGAAAGTMFAAGAGMSSPTAGDALALVGALAGTVAAFAVLRTVDRRLGGDPSLTPLITRVVDHGPMGGVR